MNDFVTISIEEYEYFKKCELRLSALEASGVDNWDGYGDAMDLLEEWENE